MKRLLAMTLFSALIAAFACAPARAQSLVGIDLIDRDSAQVLPRYAARGQTFVPGLPGHRYSVRLTNHTGQRVLVVLSVDGVNAVTGQTAHPSQGGYVLAPYETTEIAGWRKSLDDIAQFVFTDLPDSYAARTGRPDNVGTVGIAVFRERAAAPVVVAPRDRTPAPMAESRDAAAASTANAQAKSADAAVPQQLGTGHGQREWAPVGQTRFERLTQHPQQLTQLRYDAPDALMAMGVLPRWRPRDTRRGPQAFPGGFVPDPPRW